MLVSSRFFAGGLAPVPAGNPSIPAVPRLLYGVILDEEGMALACIRVLLPCLVCGRSAAVSLHGRPALYHADGSLYTLTQLVSPCSFCGAAHVATRETVSVQYYLERPTALDTIGYPMTAVRKWTDLRDQ